MSAKDLTYESAFLPLAEALRQKGFVASSVPLEGGHSCQRWARFAESWNELEDDQYLKKYGLFRQRRHGVYVVTGDAGVLCARRLPNRPHFQYSKYNTLQGGLLRELAPIKSDQGEVLEELIEWGASVFAEFSGDAQLTCEVEAHQFRIAPKDGQPGEATPEGAHRDGVEFVVAMMVARENLEEGTTTFYDESQAAVGSHTLRAPLECVLVDDTRLWHGVTPVRARDPQKPAFRDVLVLTYKRYSA